MTRWERLPHGYTNVTERSGEIVKKSYSGPGGRERLELELELLTRLADVLPVPTVVDADLVGRTLSTAFVSMAEHGQDLLQRGHASEVLRTAGELLVTLQASTPLVRGALPGDGDVLVHGDFGPQNLLFRDDGRTVAAVLDWESAHLGGPHEDLAWSEWIVRMHHPDMTPALDALFDGYGHRPRWAARHEAMLVRCAQLARSADDGARLWRDRLARTEDWVE